MRVKARISKGVIKSARESLGETQASMAERMGVSLGGWQQWEYGTRPLKGPALKLFELICEKDRVSINLSLDIKESSSKMLSTSRPEVPKEEEKGILYPGGSRSDVQFTPKHSKPRPGKR